MVGLAGLFLCFGVHYAHAASTTSRLVLYNEVQATSTDYAGNEYTDTKQVDTLTIVDGGSYALDLSKQQHARIESDLASFKSVGELYFITATGTRQLVTHLDQFGSGSFTFGKAGTYAVDVYDADPPVLTQRYWWQYIPEELLPIHIAHAQILGTFLETISFTITQKQQIQDCCSSVVFLPGIKGSILKKQSILGSTDTLWPPTIWSNDVAQLALHDDGTSVNDVYVDGVLNDFNLGPVHVPIYSGFTSYLDALVASGTIAAYLPVPYDWRLLPDTIIDDGVKTNATTSTDIIAQIEDLASHSQTGKVTIVAHSMGGLMGKAIIKKLQDTGEGDLIDAYVMVAAPQLGTPQTVIAMLHGDGEGVPSDLGNVAAVLNNSVVAPAAARQTAQNMLSSYNLLPSSGYFIATDEPIIRFDTHASATAAWRDMWGSNIEHYSDYVAFLTGESVARAHPETNDLATPEVLNPDLLAQAAQYHQTYDYYQFPDDMRVVQIAGWGRPTVKAVTYTTEHGTLGYEPVFTIEGDKIVAYPSAISSPEVTNNYFFNIKDYDIDQKDKISHKDLMSVAPVQKAITAVIEDRQIDNGTYLSDTKPKVTDVADQLILSAHSPVVLTAHDRAGDLTGISTTSQTIVEDIPGSSVRVIGQDQYIFVPKEGTYTVAYTGTRRGATTIDIDLFSADTTTPIAQYSNIPTTASTTATFVVDAASPKKTQIQVDINGDGSIDRTVHADGTQLTQLQLVSQLRTMIKDLSLHSYQTHHLLRRIELFERFANVKHRIFGHFLTKLQLRLLKWEITHLHRRQQIPDSSASQILRVVTKIKDTL